MPPQPKQSWAVPRRAINLMEALRRSIAEDKKAEARRPAPARKRAGTRSGAIAANKSWRRRTAGRLPQQHSFEPPDAGAATASGVRSRSNVARDGACDGLSSLYLVDLTPV